MKKFIALFTLALVLLATFAYAEAKRTKSSQMYTADRTVNLGAPFFLKKVKWATDGSKAMTLKVYRREVSNSTNFINYIIPAILTPGIEYFDDLYVPSGILVFDITTTGTCAFWFDFKMKN